MDLAADRPEQPLERRVDVFVGRVEVFGRDRRQPLGDLGQLVVRQQARRVQPPRVRARRRDVVRQQLGVVGLQEGPDLRREARVDPARPERHAGSSSRGSSGPSGACMRSARCAAEHAPRVLDVVHLHGQLADAVGGGERRRAPLHRQALRVVRERLAGRVDDRVVLAAPQLDRDLARDDGRDPALQRVAQHQRLRLEPAAFVEQPPEPPALGRIAVERVLVVDRRQQPLVRDVEERHAGRLVDAAALGLDDAVLDLVGEAEPVPPADLVRAPDELDRVADLLAVDGDGNAVLEPHDDDFGLDRRSAGSQWATPMIGSTIFMLVPRCSRSFASCVAPSRLASVEYALSTEAPCGMPRSASHSLISRRPPSSETNFVVEPRLVDPQARVREQAVAVEALDVVPLVGRAVAPDLDAVLAHLADEQRPRHRAAERRRVEVAAAGRLDVEGAALERGDALAGERLLAVDEERLLCAVQRGLAGNRRDVRLVVLAEIGRERVRDSAAARASRRARSTCRARPRTRSRPVRRRAARSG